MNKVIAFGYFSLMIAVAMIAVNITISKYLLTQHMSMILLLQIRFFAAVVLLSLGYYHRPIKFFKSLKKLNINDWILLAAQALCAGVFFNLFMLLGLHYTTADIGGIITSALPAMIAVLSLIFLRERLTLLMWLCVGFATLGLLLMNIMGLLKSTFHNSIVGDLFMVVSLLPEAFFYVLVKIRQVQLPALAASIILNLINFIVLLPIMFISVTPDQFAQITLSQWVLASLIGIASGCFFIFWQKGAIHVPGCQAGLVTALVPVFTVIFAGLFLHEHLTIVQFISMIMILISILLSARSKQVE